MPQDGTQMGSGLEQLMPYLIQARMAYSMMGGGESPSMSALSGLAMKFQEADRPPALSSSAASQMGQLGGAELALNQLEDLYGQTKPSSFGPFAALGGKLKRFGIGVGLASPETSAFEGVSRGSVGPIIRALGEKGALAEGDVARALEMIPKLEDRPADVDIKMNYLRNLLQGTQQNISAYGTGATPESYETGMGDNPYDQLMFQ